MESLEKTSTRTYGQFKKKKKALAAAAAAGQTPGQKSPTTPPSPVSPTTAVARSLPTVPSVSTRFCILQIIVCLFVCLFDLILYLPSTIFQLNRDGFSWVEPVRKH